MYIAFIFKYYPIFEPIDALGLNKHDCILFVFSGRLQGICKEIDCSEHI